jgi:hypothetical protein
LLKRSIKGTKPVDVNAEFLTGDPLGRMCDKSWPYTTTAFHQLYLFLVNFHDAPYESDDPSLPITKQFERDAIWKSLPMPVIGPP